MARTTVAAVQSILDTDLTATQLEAFVDDANLWVTTHLAGQCDELSTDILVAVEKYLAAAWATARDPRLKRAKIDDVEEDYQRGGETSEYLRIAADLDPCGVVQQKLVKGARKVMWRVGAGFDDRIGDEP